MLSVSLSFFFPSIELLNERLRVTIVFNRLCFCVAVIILSCLCFSLYLLSLYKCLWYVSAVDFEIDFSIVFFLLPLFVQGFPEVQQVEW